MPANTINTQFQIPGERAPFDVQQTTARVEVDARYGEQQAARLQLQELFRTKGNSERIVIDTSELVDTARNLAQPVQEQLTYADIRVFMKEVDAWIEFNQREAINNGLRK